MNTGLGALGQESITWRRGPSCAASLPLSWCCSRPKPIFGRLGDELYMYTAEVRASVTVRCCDVEGFGDLIGGTHFITSRMRLSLIHI